MSIADDGTLDFGQFAYANPQNILEAPTDGEYVCSDPIFTYYISVPMTRSARGITSMIQKRLDKLRERYIRQGNTQTGKTHRAFADED